MITSGSRKSKIQAILFDYGGVVAEEGFRNGLQALASEQGLDVKEIVEQGMRAVYDSGYVLGRGTAADFWALLRRRTGLKGSNHTLTKRLLDGFVLRRWIIRLVRTLRAQGYLVGILSDQTDWLDLLDARDHFFTEFDRVFNSFHLGKGKRDPTLFCDVAADLNLPPSKILFIDDNAGNLVRAHSTGMRILRHVEEVRFADKLKTILAS